MQNCSLFRLSIGLRQRYCIPDLQELLQLGELSNLSAFAARYNIELDQALKNTSALREPGWTEIIAVGCEAFIHRITAPSENRKKLMIRQWVDAAWYVRDPAASYGRIDDAGADVKCDNNQTLKQKNTTIFRR